MLRIIGNVECLGQPKTVRTPLLRCPRLGNGTNAYKSKINECSNYKQTVMLLIKSPVTIS